MSKTPSIVIRQLLAIISLALWSSSLQAQDVLRTQSAKPRDVEGWRLVPQVRVSERFDDNPFFLSDNGKSGVDSLSPASLASGRYTNMAGSSDYITTLRGGLTAEGPAILGRKLALGADARYEY